MNKVIVVSFFAVIGLSLLSFEQKPKFDLAASVERGKEIYLRNCVSCHMDEGQGIEGVFPPIAGSDYMLADKIKDLLQ